MPDGCSERSKLNSKEQNGRSGESRPVISGMTRGGEFYWCRSQVIIRMHSNFHFSEIWLTELSEITDFFSFWIQWIRLEQSWTEYMQIQIWFPLLSISFWIIKAQKKAVQKNNKLKKGSFQLNPAVCHERWSIMVQGYSLPPQGLPSHLSPLWCSLIKKKYLL